MQSHLPLGTAETSLGKLIGQANERTNVSGYCVPLSFDNDPEQFVSAFDNDYDDDESDVEDELEALAGSPPGSTDWKRYIGSFPKPASRELGPAYKREAQDPKHRMGDLLEACFHVYERKHPGDPTGVNFYQWLDDMADWDRVMLVSGHGLMRDSRDANVKPSMVKAFMKGVAYLDKAGRKTRRVFFNGGSAFFKAGEAGTGALGGAVMVPLNTSEMSTVFSGKGFGIWVMSEKGKLYVGNHIKGMLHHSSFLAGANVMCGGEMWARNGKIVFLTAKSGHYNPSIEHLCWALRVLQTCVDNFDSIKVMAWTNASNRLLLVPPQTVLWSANLYTAWGPISAAEGRRLRAGDFASFPDH